MKPSDKTLLQIRKINERIKATPNNPNWAAKQKIKTLLKKYQTQLDSERLFNLLAS